MLAVLHACSAEQGRREESITSPFTLDINLLYTRADSITVDVAYEPGAEPYTVEDEGKTPCWRILYDNIEALVESRGTKVFVPDALQAMNTIPEQDRGSWTTQDIVDLARTLWGASPAEENVIIHVLFLNGYYEDAQGANPQLLGVSYSGTSLLVIFKDVVASSSKRPEIRRYVEQATLVHETGHIFGLVNNGIPMITPHEDLDHPMHCTNTTCAMYWRNEGIVDYLAYVGQIAATGSLVLYCDECLDDARSFGSQALSHLLVPEEGLVEDPSLVHGLALLSGHKACLGPAER